MNARRGGLRASSSLALAFVMLASLGGDASAHGDEHAREHAAIDRVIQRFRHLPAAERSRIRWRLLHPSVARRSAAPDPPSVVGQWTSAPFPAPDYAINMMLLPGGRVLMFSMGSGHGASNGGQGLRNDGQAAIWDPALGQGPAAFKEVPPPPIALDDPLGRPDSLLVRPAPIFCAGQVQLTDGRVLIAGGNLDQSGTGLSLLLLFDPSTDTWIREPNMFLERWYPTLTRLANGRVAIEGGLTATHNDADQLELYPKPGVAVAGLDPSAPLSGNRTMLTPIHQAAGVYPPGFLLPSGRLASSYGGSGQISLYEPSTGRWIHRTSGATTYGSYPSGFLRPAGPEGPHRIVELGGTRTTADGKTETLSRAVASVDPEREASWQPAPSLNVGRRNAAAVLLPNGSAVALNGGGVPLRFPLVSGLPPTDVVQRQVELWDPITGNWTLGPSAVVPRGYHSTAVLLPDGRVLVGGDDLVASLLDTDTSDHMDSTLEIYSPPYLFRGPRPEITASPGTVGYGQRFAVAATSARPIVKATLVAPGSMTHAVDMNQRVLELPITPDDAGGYAVTGPSTSGAAPPGDYMLFVVDDQGVPSVARWIHVLPATPGQGAPTLTFLPGEEPTPAPQPPTPQAEPTPMESALVLREQSPAPVPTPAPTASPPTPTPERAAGSADLRGRSVRVRATVRTVRGRACPATLAVRVSVGTRAVDSRLPVTGAASAVTCRVVGRVKLGAVPAPKAVVRVRISGRSVQTLEFLAKRR